MPSPKNNLFFHHGTRFFCVNCSVLLCTRWGWCANICTELKKTHTHASVVFFKMFCVFVWQWKGENSPDIRVVFMFHLTKRREVGVEKAHKNWAGHYILRITTYSPVHWSSSGVVMYLHEKSSVPLLQVMQYFAFMIGRLYETEVTFLSVCCQLINGRQVKLKSWSNSPPICKENSSDVKE